MLSEEFFRRNSTVDVVSAFRVHAISRTRTADRLSSKDRRKVFHALVRCSVSTLVAIRSVQHGPLIIKLSRVDSAYCSGCQYNYKLGDDTSIHDFLDAIDWGTCTRELTSNESLPYASSYNRSSIFTCKINFNGLKNTIKKLIHRVQE